MKFIGDFLSELGQLDIKIGIENGQLRCNAPKGVLTTELRTELAERKAELLQVLHKKAIFEQAIPPLSREAALPISIAQQRLWFLAQLDGQSATYNIPTALHISGQLNETALQRALIALIERHESLRLCFPMNQGEATVQLNEVYNPLSITDLIDLSETEQLVTKLIAKQAQTPFDLSTGPLLSLHLLRLGKEEQVLLFNMHHIISDGWSMGVLIRDLSQLYNAYAQNQAPHTDELVIQYTDYAAWQRNWLEQGALESQLAYWKDKLFGAPELLELPTDYPRPVVMRSEGKHLKSTLSDQELTHGIKQISQQQGATVFMTLLAAFNVLLYRYSGQTDLVVGTPIANRTHHQTENLIGFFVNTLALRTQINDPGKQTFQELLKQVRQTALEAYAHQDIPFESLVEQLNPIRSMSHSPLFQVMFVLQNAPEEDLKLGGLNLSFIESENKTAKFDLILSITEQGNAFVCHWEYNTDLFRHETVTKMTEHFQVLLQGITHNPVLSISQLPLLTNAEKQQLLAWNKTETDYPKDKTIVDLFHAQVENTPDNIAVVYEDKQLSYKELNQKANHLAHYLLSLKTTDNGLVGICVARSLEMVIGLLGILKAGGAYVPLDPDYPLSRLQIMLEDSEVKILLSQSQLLEKLPLTTSTVVCLDKDWEQIETYSGDNTLGQSEPENLAYVIYTSGSTGVPRGVCIPHTAVVRLVKNTDYIHIDQEDCIAQASNTSFDAATFEIWGSLLNGARLVGISKEVALSPQKLALHLRTYHINTLFLTTALFNQIAQTYPECFGTLKTLLFGGEQVDPHWVRTVLEKSPPEYLLHVYGPTESTTFASWYLVKEASMQTIPIGKPIANTDLYILDSQHQPQPLGLPGELCIAGPGLARGYLNRPELTGEKFIEIELFGKPQRIYKTGDLARLLPTNGANDYNIEFLGRLDHQVKLRGFRIELSEIEVTLTQHEAIKEAVVVLYNQQSAIGNAYLVAYITRTVTEQHSALTSDEVPGVLRTWLKTRLPEYMLPASFTVLDKLPLTPNGKIDRKALPAPDLVFTETYEAPRTGIEQALVEVWNQVLKQPNIGIFDNFFERGGDSILSIQIVSHARAKGLELSPRDLFQHQTIAELAQVVKPLLALDIEQGLVTGQVPLIPIQQAFFARQLKQPWHFNQAILLTVPTDINEEALQQALAMILNHHDALRLRVKSEELVVDTVNGEIPFHIEDLRHLSTEQQEQTLGEKGDFWQASLNLETGPLVRLVLFHLEPNQSRLLWCIHHLAVDGVSWRILLEDLQTAYHQAVAEESIRLPAKTSSIKAWAEHLFNWKESESFATQAEYWRNLPNASPLPVGDPAGSNPIGDSQHYTIHFTPDMTQRLLTEAPVAYHTQINDLLLTALMLCLRDWTGETHHLIDLESHGRADLFEDIDLSRTVGWFTSLHTISLQLPGSADSGTALKAIKEQLRKVPHEGVGYGLLRYLCQENLPQGQILFNYLGQFDQSVQESEFAFATEYCGRAYSLEGKLEHLIEVNGQIDNDSLNLTWTYSGEKYQGQTIQKLADNYQWHLQQLIEHCAASYGYTPSDFPLARLNQTQLDHLAQIYNNNIADLYPLSPMQQGMLFHSLYAPERGMYFTQLHYGLSGQLDIETFYQAWQYLIDRHVILRTAFWHETDTPLQVVYKKAQLSWQTLDWRDLSEAQQGQQLQALLTNERHQGFELNQAPLMRVQVIRETDSQSRLVWHHHHILIDGWCLPIFFTELFEAYSAFRAGQIPSLPPVRPYRAYITWLSQQDQEKAKEYWQEQLKGFSAPTLLPIAQVEGPADYKEWQKLEFTLEAQLTQQLKHFSRENRVTLNTLVQGAWAALLSRYSGEMDVVFGVTTSGRQVPITGIDRILGLFINTLPLRVHFENNENNDILSTLQTIQQHQQQNNQYSYTALGDIQHWSEVRGGIALFDTIVVFENYPVDEKLENEQNTGSLKITDVQGIQYTNYPITLTVTPGRELHFRLTYESNKFQQQGVEGLLAHLSRLLEGMVTQPNQSWHQLPLLTVPDEQLLMGWNQTETDYPKDQTVVDLFLAQVEKNPEHIAVVFEDQQLSYGELNARANTIASYLLETYQLQPDNQVGILMARSLEMVIFMLGVLKAGSAYLLIDPDIPGERIHFMLKDSGAKLLLTDQTNRQKNGHFPCQTLLSTSLPENETLNSPRISILPDNLVYTIYTSGTTGTPKGTIISHRALVNYINWIIHTYQFTHDDHSTWHASVSFDGGYASLWGMLLCGGTLHILNEEVRKVPEQMVNYLVEYPISFLKITPSFFSLLVHQEKWNENSHLLQEAKAFRVIHVGGEEIIPGDIESFMKHFPKVRVINHYGPTEATIGCCVHEISSGEARIPIGNPIDNTQLHILDQYLQPVPIGVPGELHIGGAGLAQGYLNRPELTADKFIEKEVFGKLVRLYKTGDLVRWLLPDQSKKSSIEYLGRIDHQVKVRGFRIELGEIEITLSQHEAVKEAVVVLYSKEDNPRLIAYVTLASNQRSGTDELPGILRTWLRARLPEYMLPASFTVLDKLPLTPNGKVNRKELPAPEAITTGEDYQAPRDTVELKLAQIWENVLEVRPIGINDNFFERGGHSLLAIKLMNQIQQTFEVHLPIAILFERATIAELALIIHERDTTWPTLIPMQSQGTYPPLFCLPGAGGNVLYFHSLVVHLGKNQPCYGLQSPGLDGKTKMPDTIEALAAHHIKELQGLQPQGPYYLAGHSFGGKVAFEMARQLEQRGETVALLVILDTPAPTYDREDKTTKWNEMDCLWAIVQTIEELTETEFGLSKEALSEATVEQSYEQVLDTIKQQGIFFTPTAKSDQLKALVNNYKTNVQTNYKAQSPIKAPIVLFRALEQTEEMARQLALITQGEDWNWSQCTSVQVTVERTPGTHVTMFNEPYVKQLAMQLHAYLPH